jgi:dTDP-4-dehydrorhamnose 3,5-epimerase
MDLRVESTSLPDVLIVTNDAFQDARGFFVEVYRQDVFRRHGLPDTFVQLNHSRSTKGVVRGLHFQWDPPMGKLMRVTQGAAFLVAVDLRKGSPTLGQWFGIEATAESRRQVWAPASFARGFCVLSDTCEIEYLTTGVYNAAGEAGIRWDDPAIGIRWPAEEPSMSARDAKAQTLAEWLARPEADCFRY